MTSLHNIRSILVSRLRFMGDVILTLPVVRALRTAFPDARIHYLAERPYASLLENHPDIDRVIAFDTKHPFDQRQIFSRLLQSRFDLAVDLFGNPRSALLTLASRAKIRIGGDFRGRKIVYTHRIKNDPTPKNAIQFHLSYLKPLGIPAECTEPRIYLTGFEIERVKQFLEKLGIDIRRRIIGLHPGASWPAKRWMPERFSRLADRLCSAWDAQILFTEGTGEEALLDSVISGCRGKTFRSGVLPLRKLGAVLSQCELFISNDCGPMHLAPAVGTKVIGIFGPGEPEIWFPYDRKKGHRYVHHDVSCSRCHRDFCDPMDCMRLISVEDVVSAARSSLNQK